MNISCPHFALIERYLYIYFRKAFGDHCDIQIENDYEMKLIISFIFSFWLNLFEYTVGYVFIIYLLMPTVRMTR